MQDIERQLLDIVQREFGVEPGALTLDSRIADHGDSLDWVNLVFVLEGAFDVQIDADASRDVATVRDLLALVAQPASA